LPAALEAPAPAADEILFLAADPHHHRHSSLLREKTRNNQRDGACDLAAKSPSRIFADENNVFGIYAQPSRNRRHRLSRTLRAAMNEDLAVLPVRHGGAGFQALMARIWRDKRLIHDESSVFESGL